MAAASVPDVASRGSLLGKVASALHSRSRSRSGKPSKVARAVADHSGTIAALGFADTAAWHTGEVWGLIATAACILIAEFKVRG